MLFWPLSAFEKDFTTMNDEMFVQQKHRATRLVARKGWTFALQVRNNGRVYASASKRDATGCIHRAYIGSLSQLPAMTDEEIAGKIPDVA